MRTGLTPKGQKRRKDFQKREEKRWAKRNGPVEVRVDPSIVRPQKPAERPEGE